MHTLANTYRQTWKVGVVIVFAALVAAFLAARAGERTSTSPMPSVKTWVSENPQPISGSNAWFGLYSADWILADW